MYAAGHITREDESKIPEFHNHDEARGWFKSMYGAKFALTNSEMILGRKCYFYNLILDIDTYNTGQQDLLVNGFIKDMLKYMSSHQAIQIYDNGTVHIVH